MKRHFQKFRDPRFALTTLQNPSLEVRTHAELVHAAQQEREWQPTALRIPATQPLATPAAPDPIPVSELPAALPEAFCEEEFCENVASTAPDPTPAAPAPLDSAAPDSGNLDSTYPDPSNEDTQQILDSLVADVVTAGTSLPSSSPAGEQPTPRPTPKPRRKRESRHSAIHPEIPQRGIEGQIGVRRPKRPEPTFLQRHARKCAICKHPYRQEIEESFLHWRSPQTIMHCFDIKTETSIYHHAHAFNFFAQRNRNLQSALANIVETIDTCDFTGTEMLQAVRSLAHLSEDGRWIHPTSKSEFMYSMQRLPAGQAALPAAQPALPAHTNTLPAAAGEPILIASPSNIKKRRNPLKTILSYSG